MNPAKSDSPFFPKFFSLCIGKTALHLIHMKKALLSLAGLCLFMAIKAQTIPQNRLDKAWDAFWITVPDLPASEYQVCLFRKTLTFPESLPSSYVVHVSADNRYKLFVNGKMVSLGPARGDLHHWRYETVDLAPFLHPGNNFIAAQVWNEADWRPEAQISLRTGFLLQGSTAAEAAINTGDSWKCIRDESYTPLKVRMWTYYVTGPGEYIDFARQPKGWKEAAFDDSRWKKPQILFNAVPKNVQGPYGSPNGWMLVPSPLPQMELKQERFGKVVRAAGIDAPTGFPFETGKMSIPARSKVTLLLDQAYLTNAYPTLAFSGGKNATISLCYAEALFTRYPEKGNRNETEGKQMIGRKDSLLSDGSSGQIFTTLAFRTFRYVELSIETKEEPLSIDDLYSTFTGYPFQRKATTESAGTEWEQILDIGWRTARLCAVETYMDCPYYEQLQYIGDARIQALVSIYNSGDVRLLRNALNQMDESRQPEGVTLSRHPSYTPQYIPTFSLWYIGMLYDFNRYVDDPAFVRAKLPGTRQILEYFHQYQLPDGALAHVPQWMFTDWVDTKGWQSGVGPVGKDGTSAMIDLQLLWAYQLAAELERQAGMSAFSTLYSQRAQQLKKTIRQRYWVADRQLFADDAEHTFFSQHTNTLAILTGLVEGPQARQMAEHLRDDHSLAPASIYFRYYLHQAWIKAGMGNDYPNWLDKWRENIAMGMTTWAEVSDINKTRSDCHAWGASPNIEYFRTVLGIDSDGPGFLKVVIEPHLGTLTKVGGSIPHPMGELSARYELKNGKWDIHIILPKKTSGVLKWKGKTSLLKAGENRFLF